MSGVLDNIFHLSPRWLLGTADLPVFLEDAIFIGFLVSGVTATVLRVGRLTARARKPRDARKLGPERVGHGAFRRSRPVLILDRPLRAASVSWTRTSPGP